ncbi:MAG: hypothetical protein FWC43_10500 [Planctomycetaceae bacterium]|nr:hypothetical protein [Planctomycetaceae bacterium]
MTGLYVASNTQSIGAQIQLNRNINALGEVLTRLSTGLRINSGKDDPAGLIAGELLRSDISASKQAIQNTQRANSIIAVADSALGQVSSLLNDIRVLVNAAANTGAMTYDQIQANQLQVDASIDSIDRIAKTTKFQGLSLLDGYMDFSTSGVNARGKQLDDLNIYAANFGTNPTVDIEMQVKAVAEKAQLFFDRSGISEDVYLEIGGNGGKQAIRLSAGSTVEDIAKQVNMYTDATGVRAVVGQEATYGQLLVSSVGMNNDINLKAVNAGFDFGNYAVKFTAGSSAGPNVVITEPVAGKTGVIDIQLQMEPWKASAAVVDESQLGIFARNFSVGTGGEVLNITSMNGKNITALNFIPSTGPGGTGSPLATKNVAIDLDANGILNIQYLAADTGPLTAAKWQDIIDAINKMDGVSATAGSVFAALNVGAPATSVATVIGGGTINGIDQKTNNAIHVQANVNGSQMNGTDIIYVKNVLTSTNTAGSPPVPVGSNAVVQTTKSQHASISLDSGAGTTLTIDAKEAGAKWNGITVEFLYGSTTGVGGATAAYDSNARVLTIRALGLNTDKSEVVEAINRTGLFTASGVELAIGDAGSTFTSQLGAIHGIGIAGDGVAGVVGCDAGDYIVFDEAGNNKTLQVIEGATYYQTAQRASVTIENNNGTTSNYITFTATQAGASINGMNIKIENNDGTVDPKYKNNIIAAFNAEKNELHIIGDLQNATYTQLMDAVRLATNGKIQVSVSANAGGTGKVDTGTSPVGLGLVDGILLSKTFQMGSYQGTEYFQPSLSAVGSQVVASRIGTENGAIIVNAIVDKNTIPLANMTTTANMAIASINGDSSNIAFATSFTDSDGSGVLFSLTDPDSIRVFAGAMQGGSSGYSSAMTANEVIAFINSHDRLKEMFYAERAIGNDGTGYVTLFQEVAYYGDVNLQNALQFLGPKGSSDIEFQIDKNVIQRPDGSYSYKDIPNSPLYITWEYDSVVKADVALTAMKADAAFSVAAKQAGAQYSDVAIQFIRQDSATFSERGAYATYEEGPTNAVAYCSIVSAGTGTDEEVGKFILTAMNKGDNYNNVNIKVQLDDTQGEAVVAKYDANTKTLMLTLNSSGVTLSQAMSAIEKEGTFTADFDYSFNTNPHDNPGMVTFDAILGSAQNFNPVTVGNTGVTGSHTGGTIKVYLGGDYIRAEDAMNAINSSDATKYLFHASYYLGSDGSGILDFRGDQFTQVPGNNGNMVTDFRMVTSMDGKCPAASEPRMVIHLATDEFGNSITTARDLVEYFETLSAEETRGISVSLIRPAGVDNVTDLWCIDDWGKGLLQETGWFDDCYNYYPNAIQFVSANQEKVPSFAYGQVTAVNGQSASYMLYALNSGPEFEGVSIVYQDISAQPGVSEYVDYNSRDKVLTIYVWEGRTTALDVKRLIEESAATRSLFRVELADGAGGGLVTVNDDAISLKGGTRLVGEAGGAWMLGNADDDPHALVLESLNSGSQEKVSVRVIEGNFLLKNANGFVTDTATGQDAVVTLNGQKMTAHGNNVSINNVMLSLDATLSSNVRAGDGIYFSITGGGAIFQLGPSVVSNQQIRVAIPNIGSAHLGGVSGKLYQLRSGENADLSTDTKLADKIVQEAISKVAVIRGRLGALQRSTLDPNQAVLEDTIEQLSAAEAIIFNADFAEESSRMTRNQILVQSSTQVLGLINQFPQYAAQLLRG